MPNRLQHRNATVDLTSRRATFRSESINEANRSFEAVVATEAPAVVRDYETWRLIDEVLVASGGEFPQQMPLLDDHNRYGSLAVIGSAREFRQSESGWIGRGYFAEPSDGGDERLAAIWGRVRDGHIRDVSIGYVPIEWVDIPPGQTQEVNGRRYTAGERALRITTKWRAHELSITPIGADSNAKIRSHQGQPARTHVRSDSMNPRLLQFLRSLGLATDATIEQARAFMVDLKGSNRAIAGLLDHGEADGQARASCDLAIRAMGRNPDKPSEDLPTEGAEATRSASGQDPPVDEAARAVEQERFRIRRIGEFAELASVPAEMRQRAVDEAWSLDRAQERFLEYHREHNRANVPGDVGGQGPAIHSRNSQTDFTRDGLAAAMMLRNGVNDPTRGWIGLNSEGGVRRLDRSSDPQIGRAVERGFELSSLSMLEIVRRCLEVDGVRCEPTPQAIGRALELNTRAAMSTATLSGVFTTAYAAVMLDSYERTADSTAGWTVEREVPDFKTNERTRMTKAGPLQRLGKGGTAEDVTFGDAQETYKIFRYAGKFTIDEQDLINDTFGALNEFTPAEMGEAARQLRPDLVYGVLAANAAMRDSVALFHSSHGNLNTTSALAVATLQEAIKDMMVQTENGANLNIMPKYLIVPAALKWTGDALLNSAAIVYGGTTATPANNALSREGLQLVVDSRLDNGVTNPATGTAYSGSASTWYLAAPGGRHTIEVGYLRGRNRAPMIRSSILDKGQFGICFDVHHDIGAKALDWRGMVKNTG